MELSPTTDKPPSNWKKGVILVMMTWVFFTAVIAIARWLGETVSVPMLLLFQNGISLLVILPLMLKRGKKSFKTGKPKLILLRTVAGYGSFCFIFLAAQYTSTVNVVLLNNSAPLILPLIIWLWRGVKIGVRLWLGIFVGFIGIALILQPSGPMVNLGILFALFSAIFMSISMIVQRRLVKRESSRTILFYYFFISTLISIPFAIMEWKPISINVVLLLTGLGLLSVIGQMLFLRAFRFQKPSLLAPFNYSGVVYAFFVDWVFWDQIPAWKSILGILIVCAGGILSILEANGNNFPKRLSK
jgi:drug/metabolite transporter (DMT)-like permease